MSQETITPGQHASDAKRRLLTAEKLHDDARAAAIRTATELVTHYEWSTRKAAFACGVDQRAVAENLHVLGHR